MARHAVTWKASLSNGETAYEGKGQFEEIDGELSPWNKLVEYIADNDLKITSLALETFDGRTFHVPSAGKSPRFPMFENQPKPNDYRFFNAVTSVIMESGEGDVTSMYRVIEAVYDDHRLQMWVDVYNPRNCWCLVVKD